MNHPLMPTDKPKGWFFGLLTTTSGGISKSIHTISSEILADLEVFNEICYGVAHKLIDSSYRNAILIY